MRQRVDKGTTDTLVPRALLNGVLSCGVEGTRCGTREVSLTLTRPELPICAGRRLHRYPCLSNGALWIVRPVIVPRTCIRFASRALELPLAAEPRAMLLVKWYAPRDSDPEPAD